MLSPWNLVSLYRFKRISLFLFLQGNRVLCSCSCTLFAHIWGEWQLVWFLLMLWLSGKTSPQNTYRKPPSVALSWRWVFFPSPVLLCKDFCGKPLDICPVSSGSDDGDLWVVHRQKVVGLLVVQRYSLVGLAGSCIREQMSKFKLNVLAVLYLTSGDLENSQLPTGIPLLVRCHSINVWTRLLKNYGLGCSQAMMI